MLLLLLLALLFRAKLKNNRAICAHMLAQLAFSLLSSCCCCCTRQQVQQVRHTHKQQCSKAFSIDAHTTPATTTTTTLGFSSEHGKHLLEEQHKPKIALWPKLAYCPLFGQTPRFMMCSFSLSLSLSLFNWLLSCYHICCQRVLGCKTQNRVKCSKCMKICW